MTTENEAQRKEDMLMGLYKFHAYIPNDAIGSPLTPFGNFVEGYNAAKADSEREIAELQAQINRLLDGLNKARSMVGHPDNLDVLYEYLNATPSQSLKAHDDELIERCATVCDEQARDWDSDSVIIDFNYPRYCANKIRALKGE